jgi:hypothetical protein
MSDYQYRVVKDYYDNEFGYQLVSGEVVSDNDFAEPDMPARLVGLEVLEAADKKAENKRLDKSGGSARQHKGK